MQLIPRSFLQPRKRNWFSYSAFRMVTTTCRGEPISREQLFSYTNGRFLMDEEYQISRRYAAFNVDELCKLVSSLPSIQSPVSNIDKVEGGFNKALMMRMENGKEVVVKIPFPNSVPRQYATESEVAVLDYVRLHTSVPVPTVLAWSSHSSNPVGAEYLVLEKVTGRQLNEVWDEMSGNQRFNLVKSLAQFDAELAKIRFPAYGNLYSGAMCKEKTVVALSPNIDPHNKYCVGPAVRPSTGHGRDDWPDNISGPWNDLIALGTARVQLGIWNLSHGESRAVRGPHFGSQEEHLRLLTAAQNVLSTLAPLVQKFSIPVLWHPDLHMGNVFVSEEDYTQVVGLIDWQFSTILPTLIQAQWPRLLTIPDNYETGPNVPQMPANVDEMNEEEQNMARQKYEEEFLAKCYEIALNRANHEAGSALSESPEAIRQLFLLCPDTYKDGIVPLRECLIKISRSWEASGFPGSCPIQFTSDELSLHQEQLGEYEDWRSLRQYTFDLLSTDEEGWVPPQLTFEAIRAYERKLFQLYMDSQEPGVTEDKAKALWFFLPPLREQYKYPISVWMPGEVRDAEFNVETPDPPYNQSPKSPQMQIYVSLLAPTSSRSWNLASLLVRDRDPAVL